MPRPPRSKPSYFDISGGEAGVDPHQECCWLVDRFALAAETFPDWVVETRGNLPVRLTLKAHVAGHSAVVGAAIADAEAELEFLPDKSGWLLVVGRLEGTERFRAYLDHPYEEYEFWPADASPADRAEAPGRAGKHSTWISLDARSWPALAPLANDHGVVNLSVAES